MSGEGKSEQGGEVISFEDASHPHVHARKEEKLAKVKKAFRAATKELFREKPKENRNKRKRRKKKK